MELQTMPLRFRVWDREQNRFLQGEELLIFQHDYYQVGNTILDIAPQYSARYVMSQDTGFIDKNCKSIYTGDILSYEYPDEEPITGV